MVRHRVCSVAIGLAVLMLSVYGCSRDMPTSSAGFDAHAVLDESPIVTTTTLVSEASGTVRHFPELDFLDASPADADLQSSYFRTTEINREFRRGVAEFAIPEFRDVVLSAKIALSETRATIAEPLPPDRHELSSYEEADLGVSVSDFDRPASLVGTFETDANLPTQTFEFDVTSLVAESQGSNLGFRVKLEADPTHAGVVPLGTAFARSSDPPGVTIEVITATAAEASDHLQDVIRGMALPPDVEASLLGPVQLASRLLNDDNPNNDRAACGGLGAFLHQVATGERSGQLSARQATELRRLALGIRTSLGCAGPSTSLEPFVP